MDETAWLSCVDPNLMLEYLFAHRVTRRKLRLLACACCRHYWASLTDRRTRQTVVACEQNADRLITRAQLVEAAQQAQLAEYEAPQFERSAYTAVLLTASTDIRQSVHPALGWLQQMARWEAAYECVPGMDETAVVNEAERSERARQCAVVRELWGNPFRYLPVNEDWRRWQDGTVVKLARAIYDERNFHDLPILADALMDAGCGNERLVEHFQTPEGHSLGCWALDAVLGRE